VILLLIGEIPSKGGRDTGQVTYLVRLTLYKSLGELLGVLLLIREIVGK
jgi:hypothetical protein